MSRHILRTVVLTVCLAAAVAPALSESIERNNDNPRLNTVKPKGLTALFGSNSGTEGPVANEIEAQQTQSVVGERTINITQPEVPDVVPQQQPQPEPQQQQLQAAPVQEAPPPVVDAEPAPRQAAPANSAASKAAEADWWNKTGNPKVFSFRDCISGHARAQAQGQPKVSLKSVLADAMKGECKAQFAEVSNALVDRFGSRRGKQMAEELSGSTFVPAVREAVLTVRKEQQIAEQSNRAPAPAAARTVAAAAPQPASPVPVPSPEPQAQPAGTGAVAATASLPAPEPVGPALDVAIAKEELFTCYRTRTDAVGAQPGSDIDMVVDQVLLECSDHTRAFFARLFAAHPLTPAKQAEKMREAIAQNYRPAIAERIKTLRASGAAATRPSGGTSTVVKSVTSNAQ